MKLLISIYKVFVKLYRSIFERKKYLAIKQFNKIINTLNYSDIAIDCGANVGLFALKMASSGATVYAFEPNPYAYDELVKRTSNFPNIICYNKAVAGEASEVKLFLHEHSEQDQVKWSTGSSLLSYKGNVQKDNFHIVEAVDFIEFINSLGKKVMLIKIDIEGAEINLIERIIDSGSYKNIGQIFVETHEHKIPELVEPTNTLRARIKKRGITNINLNWD
jgi:FkbM family methyltransferase